MCKVNPKVDLVFKKLFGVDQNKDLLLSLINSILAEDDKMKEVTIKNPYNLPDYLSGKLSILDIKAEDEKGRKYNIEMQIVGHYDYGQRTMFYWAQAFAEQIGSGSIYSDLNKTIVINIVDFDFFKEEEGIKEEEKRYHREIILSDRLTNENYNQLDYLSIHFVELQKYNEDKHGVKNALDRWITFLNRASELDEDNIPEQLTTKEIKKAVKELNTMYLQKKEQEHYNGQRMMLMDEISRKKTAEIQMREIIEKGRKEGMEKGRKEGMKEGVEKGMKEGVEKGMKEGVEKGMKEGVEKGMKEEKINIAKKLKNNGIPIDIIAKTSGLSIEEIEKL